MFTQFLNPLAIAISLATVTGVVVHDTHVGAALALPTIMVNADESSKQLVLSGATHTHAERGSLSQAVHDLKTPTPSIQPRSHEDRKHLLQKHTARGHHAFDNYNLPIV
jgi:hypothetical protein